MRHRVKKHLHFKKRDCAHRNAIIRNLVTSIFTHGFLCTTQKKAKAIVPYIDSLINIAQGTAAEFNKIRSISEIVFTDIASHAVLERSTKYGTQKSGFTRIVPLQYRDGDAAKLVKIELI